MTVPPKNVQFGFSTMGVPDASLPELLSLALEFKMDFVELRALENTIDLPAYFAANPISNRLVPIQPPVRLIATNLRLSEATQDDIDHFLRFVDVAEMLRAPYLRVFGGGPWGEPHSESQLEHAAKTLEHCRSAIKAKAASCEILMETHSGFSSSDACLQLNKRLREPVKILWDSHHTWRNAGESPEETWWMIGSLVRHIHFSDSRLKLPPESGYEVVLPNFGEYPAQALRTLLGDVHYAHGISLEWEKIWHPELPDIRQAINEFQRVFVDDNLSEKLEVRRVI